MCLPPQAENVKKALSAGGGGGGFHEWPPAGHAHEIKTC